MNLDHEACTGKRQKWKVEKNNSHQSFCIVLLLVDSHEGYEPATACQGESQGCQLSFPTAFCKETAYRHRASLQKCHSFLQNKMSLTFYRVSWAHEGPLSLQRLMRLNECSHSDPLLIFFWLTRTGLFIAFPVPSGSIQAMEDQPHFAGYKPINKVKCREVQCIYFIHYVLKYRWGWLLLHLKHFCSANVKYKNHSIISRET